MPVATTTARAQPWTHECGYVRTRSWKHAEPCMYIYTRKWKGRKARRKSEFYRATKAHPHTSRHRCAFNIISPVFFVQERALSHCVRAGTVPQPARGHPAAPAQVFKCGHVFCGTRLEKSVVAAVGHQCAVCTCSRCSTSV